MKTITRQRLQYTTASLIVLIVIFLFQFVVIRQFPHYHDLVRHVYYIPIILGAYLLGLRGGIFFGLMSAAAASVHIALHGHIIFLDLILQASVFCAVGGIIGYFSDDEKKKRVLLETSGMDFLKGLSGALDARDTYTEGHSLRVAGIACLIGRECGLSEKEIEALYQAGIIHDIGKIGIPDAILRKEGKLTDEEYAIIKTHPLIGESIIREVEIFKSIIAGIKSHHEKFDGTGYPDGLKKGDIPPMARIIAIADAFDAMTSIRLYNRRKDKNAAFEEIEMNAGTQFDPDLVAAFRKVVRSIRMETLESTVVDPVCLMKINPSTAPASFLYEGVTYYFCAENCREAFAESPGKYIAGPYGSYNKS